MHDGKSGKGAASGRMEAAQRGKMIREHTTEEKRRGDHFAVMREDSEVMG